MTFGYSRDDISKFLPVYLEKGILQYDPFQVRPDLSMCSLEQIIAILRLRYIRACVHAHLDCCALVLVYIRWALKLATLISEPAGARPGGRG